MLLMHVIVRIKRFTVRSRARSFFCFHFFNFLWSKKQERHDATLLLRNRRLPTTADKHLAVQLSSNHGEYVDLD